MPRLTRFEEYRDRYPDFALEKTDDGILLMRMHRDGGPAVWDERTHHDTAEPLQRRRGRSRRPRRDLHRDRRHLQRELGTARASRPSFKAPTEWAEEMGWYGRLRHINLLEIDAIMIAAVNGPSNIHSELAFMCDVVLASDDAYFQDMAHFPRNLSPGDGIQNIWPLVMGRNRYRYAQLMGQKITAQMAHEWGAVNEVLPKDRAAGSRLGDRALSAALLADRPAPHAPDLRPGVQARRGQRSRLRADAWSCWA